MIIKRYLSKEVFQSVLTVISVLMLAFISQQLVRYMNFVAVGKIATNVLLELVSFEIPYLAAILLPLAFYLGIMLAYGRLYTDNEMSIMQMSGFTERRILRLTGQLALGVSFVVLVLMLWVNPWISGKRQQLMESDEATLHLIQTLIPGRFQVSPDGKRVMYVETLSRDRQRAENVFMAEQKPKTDPNEISSWMLVFADQGYQQKIDHSPDPYFVTTDGYRYEGTPGNNAYKVIQFKKYAVRIPQGDARLNHQEDESLSTTDLFKQRDNPTRAAELQWRLSLPISAFLLGLLAVPFSAIKPRSGRFLVMLPAILIYIVYINLLFMARHWVDVGTVSTVIGMWWVHLLMLGVVMTALWVRSRQWV